MSALHRNIRIIADALTRVGAKSVTVNYAACDGEREQSELEFEWENKSGELPKQLVIQDEVRRRGGPTTKVAPPITKTLTFDDALDVVCAQALNTTSHIRFTDGRGDFTIFADGAPATLNHATPTEEQVYDSMELVGAEAPDASLLERAIHITAAHIRAAGISLIEIEYTGSCDSGDGYSITADGNDLPSDVGDITFERKQDHYDDVRKQWITQQVEVTEPFEEAVSILADWMIDAAGHRGYQDNEGGGGVIRLTVDGHASLEHYDNIESEETDTFIFDAVTA